MMHRNRSRDPPPYHPGWGGLARKLALEENTIFFGKTYSPSVAGLRARMARPPCEEDGFRACGVRTPRVNFLERYMPSAFAAPLFRFRWIAAARRIWVMWRCA